ncbi:hypothetical protein Q7P37_006942 [Cladosporium fusiforme]
MPVSSLAGVSSDEFGNTSTNSHHQNHHSDPHSLPAVCAQVHQRLGAFLASEPRNQRLRGVQEQSRLSLRIIEEALDRYRRTLTAKRSSLDELSFSYNGGKDCLVLLILYLSALHKHTTTRKPSVQPIGTDTPVAPRTLPDTLPSVYIVSPHPFPEVDTFVDDSVQAYHLSLARYSKPMREAFSDYLADHPPIRAIFVGTRRTDPHGAELQYFDPTDRGWPSFMRIHPVIDWHYAEVWAFLKELDIPYCGLYDLGYTSLGGTTDTHPNPALKQGADGGFRPAYELEQDEEERLGRDR